MKYGMVTLVYSVAHQNLTLIKIQDARNGNTVNFQLISLNRCNQIDAVGKEVTITVRIGN